MNNLIPDIIKAIKKINDEKAYLKDELKKAVREFKGTVLIVSHEPDFYMDIVTDVWNVEDWTTKII